MKTYRSRGRNGMLPAGHVTQNHVIAVDANQPIDNANKHCKKQIQWRHGNFGLGQLRMERKSNNLRNDGSETEQIADPKLGKGRERAWLNLIGWHSTGEKAIPSYKSVLWERSGRRANPSNSLSEEAHKRAQESLLAPTTNFIDWLSGNRGRMT